MPIKYLSAPGAYRVNANANRLYRVLANLLFLILLATLVGCGGGGGSAGPAPQSPDPDPVVPSPPPPPPPPTLTAIEVSTAAPVIVKNTQTTAIATALYSDNSKRDVTEEVQWSSSATAVVTIDDAPGNKGIVHGVGTGEAQIIAALQGTEGSASISVTSADLIGLSITPSSELLPAGTTLQLRVTGQYSNNTVQDLTTQVSWLSSNPQLASVDTAGMVNALSPGAVSISASLGDHQASATLDISNAQLVNLALIPAQISLAIGTQQSLTLIGEYSDGSSRDISQQATWSSNQTDIVTLTAPDANLSAALLLGVATGSASVTASLNGLSADAAVTVTDAVAVELIVTPASIALPAGLQQQANVVARYSDNSTQDVTALATWSTTNTALATVSNAQGAEGLISAVAKGAVSVNATFQDLSASVEVTVSDATLRAINVSPPQPDLALSTTLRLRALGAYSDGSSHDISSRVTWLSATPVIASVGSATGNAGLVQALAVGTSIISASVNGLAGIAELTVRDTTLQSLEIVPASIELARGTREALRVIGHFADASTQDLTHAVAWSVSDIDVASVAVARNGTAVLQTGTTGTTSVTATLAGSAVPAASAAVTVSNATLQSISLSPVDSSVSNNVSSRLIATGHFSDGSTQDVNEMLTWISSDPSVLAVSNTADEKGLITGVIAAGNSPVEVTVRAVYAQSTPALEAQTTVSVSYLPQRPVSLVLVASPNVILNNGTDMATLSVEVKAAAPDSKIADNTPIDFEVSNGAGTLLQSSALTVDGHAEVQMYSLTEGFNVITARVRDTDISNYTVVWATALFEQAFIRFYSTALLIENNQVLPGSQFAEYIFNLSNRTFDLPRFEFVHDGSGTVIEFVEAPQFLNNNLITGGKIIKGLVTLEDPYVTGTTYRSTFYLGDSNTGQTFTLSVFYPL